MSAEAKAEHVLALNLARRHLTAGQKEHLAADLRLKGLPYLKIAQILGYHNKGGAWKAVQRAGVSQETPAQIEGADGKSSWRR